MHACTRRLHLSRYGVVRLLSLVAVFSNTNAYLHTNKTHANEHEMEDLCFPAFLVC